MKTILCFGDSITRGWVPGSYDLKTGLTLRYSQDKRWPGIVQLQLGSEYLVIEEALNGRTAALDEIMPGRAFRNGLSLLPYCLEAHYPIDLVVLMLGTNDCKNQFNKTPLEIADNMRQIIKTIKACKYGPNATAPKILLIAPQAIINNPNNEYNGEAIIRSQALPTLYQVLAAEERCEFLDASRIIKSSPLDGVHIDDSQHAILAQAVVAKISAILAQ